MAIFCIECNRKDFDCEFSIVKVLPFASPQKDDIDSVYHEECNITHKSREAMRLRVFDIEKFIREAYEGVSTNESFS